MLAIIAATPGVAEERAARSAAAAEERAARTAAAAEEARQAAVAWSVLHPGARLADGAATLGVPVARLRTLLGDRVAWHPPRRPVRLRYTDEQLLRHVSEWVAVHGPSETGYGDAARGRPGWPSLGTVTGRFGSWRLALQAAGLTPPPAVKGRSRVWSDEALAHLVAGYLAETPTPTHGGFGVWLAAETTRPSLTLVRRRLGTWPQLMARGVDARRAGPPPPPR